MKNVYEIFDEFEEAKNKKQKMQVLENNLSTLLVNVLQMTYHPNIRWKIKEMPDNYKIQEDSKLPGLSRCQLSTEIRKLYMFQEGNATAEALTPRKQNELLIQLLESLEPREAEVVMGIFRKDQGVEGLNYKFVKEAFPEMLP
jgi:hypothetical protein